MTVTDEDLITVMAVFSILAMLWLCGLTGGLWLP
jgi:hypothetical protein